MPNSVDVDLKKGLISNQACFSQLTPDEVGKLASLFKETYFAAGETIVTEGDPVDSIYLIIKGTTEVRHVTLQKQVLHVDYIATLKEGDAIGLDETGFYSLSGRRTATVVAISDVTTLRLSVAEFHGFTLENSRVHEVMFNQARKILDQK
jgi:CRP-like cAMP-binding protein